MDERVVRSFVRLATSGEGPALLAGVLGHDGLLQLQASLAEALLLTHEARQRDPRTDPRPGDVIRVSGGYASFRRVVARDGDHLHYVAGWLPEDSRRGRRCKVDTRKLNTEHEEVWRRCEEPERCVNGVDLDCRQEERFYADVRRAYSEHTGERLISSQWACHRGVCLCCRANTKALVPSTLDYSQLTPRARAYIEDHLVRLELKILSGYQRHTRERVMSDIEAVKQRLGIAGPPKEKQE